MQVVDIPTRRGLMRQLADIRRMLEPHGIRDAGDYAEVLVAEALGGRRECRTKSGHDVVCESHGRVEVKCRQLPPDGRIEERVAIGASKHEGFEYLAVVVFQLDFTVKGAVLVPYADAWTLAASQKFRRISYSQARQLPGTVDITAEVQAASTRYTS
jgi:hypothetical protein